MNIGVALRYYRKASKMTQNQLAEKADINEKYYGEIERNESSPTIDKLEKICLALGLDMYYIVSYKSVKKIKLKVENKKNVVNNKVEYYCNCCGTGFYSKEKDVICPQCGCEYDEDNNYIEKYL